MIRIAMTVSKELLNEFDECLKKRMDTILELKECMKRLNEYIERHKY